MASDSANPSKLRDLMPEPSREHGLALKKLDLSFDHHDFLDQLDSVNAELTHPHKPNALRNIIVGAQKHVAFNETTPETAAHVKTLLPSAEAMSDLKLHVEALGKEYEAKLKHAYDTLAKPGGGNPALGANGSDESLREIIEADIKELSKKYRETRDSLINDAAYQPFLKDAEKQKQLYYAPLVRDHLIEELEKDAQALPNLKNAVGEQARMVKSTYVTPVAKAVKEAVTPTLASLQDVIDHIHEYTSSAHGRIDDKEKMIQHLENEFSSRGVKNFSLPKHEMTSLLNEYSYSTMDRYAEDRRRGWGVVSQEIHELSNKMFKVAEHDGSKHASMLSQFGVAPARIGVGVAGLAASSAGSYWIDRVRGKQRVEEQALVVDEQGNVQPASKKDRTLEFVGASTVSAIGFYAFIDAIINGPLTQAIERLINNGRGK